MVKMRNAKRPLLRSASLVISTDLRSLDCTTAEQDCAQTARGPQLHMPLISRDSLRCTELHLGIAQMQAEIEQLKDQIARSQAQIGAAETDGYVFKQMYDRKLAKMLATLERAHMQNIDVIRESDKLRATYTGVAVSRASEPDSSKNQASTSNCALHREVSQLGSKTQLRRNRSVVLEISHSAQIYSAQAAQKRLLAQAQHQLSELESEVASAQTATRQLEKQLRVREQQAESKMIAAGQLQQLCDVVLRVFRVQQEHARRFSYAVAELSQQERPAR